MGRGAVGVKELTFTQWTKRSKGDVLELNKLADDANCVRAHVLTSPAGKDMRWLPQHIGLHR